MRILHTADWHLGASLRGHSRLDEQEKVLDEICRIAIDERVDAVIVAGDIFDVYLPPAAAEALYFNAVARLADCGRRPVVVIAGNHDSPERLAASSVWGAPLGVVVLGRPWDAPSQREDRGANREMKAAGVAGGAGSFVKLRTTAGEYINLIAIPFPSESRMRSVPGARIYDDEGDRASYNTLLARMMSDLSTHFVQGEANLVTSHLYVADGAESGVERPIQVGGAYSVYPATFPASAAYIALGHLHRPQEFHSSSGAAIRYSGSPVRLGFSEAGQEKSVTIIEVENGVATHRTVGLTGGHGLHRIDIVGCLDDIDARLRTVPPDDWISITLTSDELVEPERMDNVRSLHSGILEFVVRSNATHHENNPQPLLKDLPVEEAFGRFVAERFKEQIDEKVMRIFLDVIASSDPI